eukprot:GEMP01037705.1.p1 GENE.GEMP01037705.1~~GEMP01037705.1.p1  ORF type:complete len:344 (+),score=64.14 GEMP01037705.1:31-1062(+)
MLDLPEKEFTYIGRPWNSFAGRWDGICAELDQTDGNFTLLDVGSCNGYFCLQAAHRFPSSIVIGLEGSVGIGNGTIGADSGNPSDILQTTAVCTHLKWAKELNLTNCHLAPEVWTYETVCRLVANGLVLDHLLLLSVIHHMDRFSCESNRYSEAGFSHLEGTLDLTSKLLQLGYCSYIELPDRPWLAHVYDVYKSQHNFLLAACRRAFGAEGGPIDWALEGPIYNNQWFGNREVYLVRRPQEGPRVAPDAVMDHFPALLPWRDQEIRATEHRVVLKKNDPVELLSAQKQLQLAIDEAHILLDETRRQHRIANARVTAGHAVTSAHTAVQHDQPRAKAREEVVA